uniref:7TM_GPCR_Srx domain-containing protein n=1 Tax=Parastrongyloides trichosuri TaxID=131310 RepID=A0A0N4Z7L3_PARTI
MPDQAPIVRACGWMTIFFCSIFICAELTNLIVLCSKKQLLKKNVVYLIITVLGFLDCIQQTIHLFSGIFCVTQWKPPLRIDMFLGSLLDFLYNLSILTNLVLSINRFYIFYEFNNWLKYTTKFIFSFFVSTFVLAIITFFILHQFYYLRVVYSIELAYWDFVSTIENNYAHHYLENRIMTAINFASLFIFSLAMIKLFITKCISTATKKSLQKYEYYIFMQAGLNFFGIFATQVLWEFGVALWPNYDYLYTVLNFIWVLTSGRDGCMNIFCLGEVRDTLLDSLKKKKHLDRRHTVIHMNRLNQ